MSQAATFWQKYGTLAQMAQASVARSDSLRCCSRSTRSIRTTARPARVKSISATPISRSAIRNSRCRTTSRSRPGRRTIRCATRALSRICSYACEEALAAFAGKQEWQTSCDYDLRHHLPFLCERNAAEPAYLTTYATRTQQWIKASLQRAGVDSAGLQAEKDVKGHDQASRRWQGSRCAGRIHAVAGVRGGGRRDSALLLPRTAVDRRQLPHVPGRAERLAEAGGKLRLGRARLPSGPERRVADSQHQVCRW